MHSYNNVNRDFREQYQLDIKNRKTPSQIYPANVNLKNYTYFLFAPTLCYEAEYPRSGPFRLWYALYKGAHSAGALVKILKLVFSKKK